LINVRLFILLYLLIWPWSLTVQIGEGNAALFSENTVLASAKSDEESGSKGDSKGEPIKAIEKYEKEKLAKYKRNIGKRFMAIRTSRPPEFYESPDNLGKKAAIKEKEEFLIMNVVQNQSGTMNFYKVRLESGKIAYLGADGSNLELRIKDGSIMRIPKKVGKKKSPRASSSQQKASRAIELVKKHLIPSDPVSKDKRSIERRMKELKATSSPNLRWRYEAKKIGDNKYRVTQYVEGESSRPIVRTWTVDLLTSRVSPGDPAAKELYR